MEDVGGENDIINTCGLKQGVVKVILDATAGNRKMWMHKNADHIIYIDIEKRLEVPPTIFADYRHTPFPDHTFDTIFFDPPHNWGAAIHYFSFPSKAERREVWPRVKGVPTYYGWDKYKTRNTMVKSIYEAGREFQRILKPDGLLWLKWNEMRITIDRILTALTDWTELMRLYVNDPTHTAGEHQTYWICLCKKSERVEQQPLEVYG